MSGYVEVGTKPCVATLPGQDQYTEQTMNTSSLAGERSSLLEHNATPHLTQRQQYRPQCVLRRLVRAVPS